MERMSLPRRLVLFFPVALFAALPLALARGHDARGTAQMRLAPRMVILVRHAEKSTEGDPKDPELSAAGKERAEELARTLARCGATRLVASEYQRTQATLAPLSERLKLGVDVRPAAELEALATELVSAEPGSVIVVSGHSNTLPALAARLGVALSGLNETPQGPQLGDDEYDRLFVLYLPPNDAPVKPSVVELRYGK